MTRSFSASAWAVPPTAHPIDGVLLAGQEDCRAALQACRPQTCARHTWSNLGLRAPANLDSKVLVASVGISWITGAVVSFLRRFPVLKACDKNGSLKSEGTFSTGRRFLSATESADRKLFWADLAVRIPDGTPLGSAPLWQGVQYQQLLKCTS